MSSLRLCAGRNTKLEKHLCNHPIDWMDRMFNLEHISGASLELDLVLRQSSIWCTLKAQDL